MQQKVGFTKGMRRALSPENYGEESYFEAINKEVVFDEGSLTAAITDEKGTTQLSDINTLLSSGDTVIKIYEIEEWLVAFIKTSASKYVLKRFKINSSNAITDVNLIYSNSSLSTTVMDDNIEAVFRYRDSSFCKIYWTSGIGQLRSLNIFEDNSSISASMLNAFPPLILSEPKVTSIEIGGIQPVGKYQYAYQLFNLDGVETPFSPPSFPVVLGSGSLSVRSNEFLGGVSGDISSKSCKVTITNLDSNYDSIRIVSIYYKDSVSIPEIRLVAESKLGSSTFTFTDTGAITLDVYTPEEFSFIGGNIFTCKTITTKDNYFIAANIEEENFDIDSDLGSYWDARAYRFTSLNNTNFMVDSTSYNSYSSVPEEANCILTKLNQSTDHKFKRFSNVLGGTGANINYEFFVKSIPIDSPIVDGDSLKTFGIANSSTQSWSSLIDSGFSDNVYYNNYASPINAGQLPGYQRNEIYRFGIVFIKDGRHSFVKWIGDIKFPGANENNGDTVYTIDGIAQTDYNTFYRDSTGVMYANILGIKFNVANVPTGYKWQIVRVPRTEADKTVLTQGVLSYNKTTAAGGGPSALTRQRINLKQYLDSGANLDVHTVCFNSPEINYEITSIGKTQNDKLVFQKAYSYLYQDYEKLIDPSGEESPENLCMTRFYKVVDKLNLSLGALGTFDDFTFVKDTIKLSPAQKGYIDSYGQTFISNTFTESFGDDQDYTANGGITQYISLFTELAKFPGGEDNDKIVAVFNYEREKDSAIYGGNTYAARTINNYIKCGSLETGNGATEVSSYVLLGDTFLNFFEFLNLSFIEDRNSRTGHSETVYIPLESSINLDMVNGFLRSKNYMARELSILQEKNEYGKSILPVEVDNTAIQLEQGASKYLNAYGDMYVYNNAYSREPDVKKYFPKPLNFRVLDKKPCKIVNSEIYNGSSLSDPWLKFMYVSDIELDGQYGEITKIIDFNNKLLGFQKRAIAIVGFNDREVIQSNNSTSLTLGTGDRLSYYQYLTKTSGTKYKSSILDTGNGLYYLDDINKKLMTFQDNGVIAVSDLGECTDLFNNLLFTADKVNCGYNSFKRKLYYTIGQELTISFNEKMGAFESKHTYYPSSYFNYKNSLYSIPQDKLTLWKNNSGDALKYFGTTGSGSITLLFNGGKESYKYKKVFNNLEFQARYKKADNSIETIYSSSPISNITLFTGYQSKTVTSELSSYLRNRFYTWRFALPRDSSARRFMDYYVYVTLNNNPASTASNLLTIDDVSIHYVIPII